MNTALIIMLVILSAFAFIGLYVIIDTWKNLREAMKEDDNGNARDN